MADGLPEKLQTGPECGCERCDYPEPEAPWSDLTPMLAALSLPIPPEGMEPLLTAMRIIYGEPVRMESKGNFLLILRQPEGESDS